MTSEAPSGEVIVYDTPDGGVRVEVRLDRDTVWLTQRQMADLFDTSTDNISLHQKKCLFRQGVRGERHYRGFLGSSS
jgi:hypothetical protein